MWSCDVSCDQLDLYKLCESYVQVLSNINGKAEGSLQLHRGYDSGGPCNFPVPLKCPSGESPRCSWNDNACRKPPLEGPTLVKSVSWWIQAFRRVKPKSQKLSTLDKTRLFKPNQCSLWSFGPVSGILLKRRGWRLLPARFNCSALNGGCSSFTAALDFIPCWKSLNWKSIPWWLNYILL